jgi:ribonuclease-3
MADSEQRNGRSPDLDELEEILGYQFEDGELLQRALTHSSFANEQDAVAVVDNERLEFLGDAVLGLVISTLLFKMSGSDEGVLTRAKSHLVSARFIGRLARNLRLGSFLKLGHGEEKDGGRRKNSILANVFEAVIGAVYLDGGMEAARSFIEKAYGDSIAELDRESLLREDYKSYLQELIQSRDLPIPRYTLVRERGPDHSKEFTVEVCIGESERAIARGSGRSKKAAEQRAAQAAVELIEKGDIEPGPPPAEGG